MIPVDTSQEWAGIHLYHHLSSGTTHNIPDILDKYQPILDQSKLMRKAVPNTLIPSFRQPPNLRKLLVTAKLELPSDSVPMSHRPCARRQTANQHIHGRRL